MTAAEKVIEAFGARRLAGLLGLHRTSVYRWNYPVEDGGCGGAVPHRYHYDILHHAKMLKLKIKPKDLVNVVGQ